MKKGDCDAVDAQSLRDDPDGYRAVIAVVNRMMDTPLSDEDVQWIRKRIQVRMGRPLTDEEEASLQGQWLRRLGCSR